MKLVYTVPTRSGPLERIVSGHLCRRMKLDRLRREKTVATHTECAETSALTLDHHERWSRRTTSRYLKKGRMPRLPKFANPCLEAAVQPEMIVANGAASPRRERIPSGSTSERQNRNRLRQAQRGGGALGPKAHALVRS
jgi:hypothetical protein